MKNKTIREKAISFAEKRMNQLVDDMICSDCSFEVDEFNPNRPLVTGYKGHTCVSIWDFSSSWSACYIYVPEKDYFQRVY